MGRYGEAERTNEDQLLAACYQSALALAAQYKIRTIAFPAIATGAYGFLVDRAAGIAVRETSAFLKKTPLFNKSSLFVSMTKPCIAISRRCGGCKDAGRYVILIIFLALAALYALLFLYTLFFADSMIFFHGANDQTISLWHSQALFRTANQPKQLAPIQNGGHNDLLQIGSNGYFQILKNFVDSLLPANNR